MSKEDVSFKTACFKKPPQWIPCNFRSYLSPSSLINILLFYNYSFLSFTKVLPCLSHRSRRGGKPCTMKQCKWLNQTQAKHYCKHLVSKCWSYRQNSHRSVWNQQHLYHQTSLRLYKHTAISISSTSMCLCMKYHTLPVLLQQNKEISGPDYSG